MAADDEAAVHSLKAPHELPPDAEGNAAFRTGKSHIQYPFAALAAQETASSSGGFEGNATYNPTAY